MPVTKKENPSDDLIAARMEWLLSNERPPVGTLVRIVKPRDRFHGRQALVTAALVYDVEGEVRVKIVGAAASSRTYRKHHLELLKEVVHA